MILGIPTAKGAGERRVALVPEEVGPLAEAGLEVVVQAGAGADVGIPDDAFAEAGAKVLPTADEVVDAADIIAVVHAEPTIGEGFAMERLRPGQVLVGLLNPLGRPQLLSELADEGVTALALELVPRISRAQAMDALTSMATLAGYRAALLTAHHLPRFLPLMMTPAGTLPPAQVLVLGAGVAGLSAIATARRLGAVVSAYDVRAAAREEIASLGATPVDLGLDTTGAEGAGGYAAAMDDAFYARQRAALGDVVATHDAVIATAAVQGGPAPLLVTREAVERMRFGSVIVDCAAAGGGNCEVTQPGETVQAGGVTVLGPLDLAGTMPQAASRMYARNVRELLQHLVREGRLVLDRAEPIAAETLCTRDGQVVLARARELLGLAPDHEGESA